MERSQYLHQLNMATLRTKFLNFTFLLFCLVSFGFDTLTSNSIVGCAFNFESDLKANKIKLFIIGGIAPRHVQGQEQHEKMYNFEYYNYGCTPEADECIKSYSTKAFKHLDQKYGKLWRNFVRQDVLYLRGKNHL